MCIYTNLTVNFKGTPPTGWRPSEVYWLQGFTSYDDPRKCTMQWELRDPTANQNGEPGEPYNLPQSDLASGSNTGSKASTTPSRQYQSTQPALPTP